MVRSPRSGHLEPSRTTVAFIYAAPQDGGSRVMSPGRPESTPEQIRKLGLISYNGKIEVHRSLLNAILCEKPQLLRDDGPLE